MVKKVNKEIEADKVAVANVIRNSLEELIRIKGVATGSNGIIPRPSYYEYLLKDSKEISFKFKKEYFAIKYNKDNGLKYEFRIYNK